MHPFLPGSALPLFVHRHAAPLPRLLSTSPDDGKSELLHCKVFALVAGELYRSHGGQLFEYANGAWPPASLGLTSVNLEFILQALRRAQAYFSIMAHIKPKRRYDDIVFEIKAIQQVGMEELLLQWQLQDILPRKPEIRAREWLHGLSELCRSLRHQFDEHSRTNRASPNRAIYIYIYIYM